MPTKTCTRCSKTYPATLEYFPPNRGYGKDDLYSRCRECARQGKRESNRQIAYGVSPAEVAAMLDRQGSKCWICEEKIDVGHVDHCHTHGHVRGVLCRSCNHGLGNFKDSISNLANAIRYLEENGRAA